MTTIELLFKILLFYVGCYVCIAAPMSDSAGDFLAIKRFVYNNLVKIIFIPFGGFLIYITFVK